MNQDIFIFFVLYKNKIIYFEIIKKFLREQIMVYSPDLPCYIFLWQWVLLMLGLHIYKYLKIC